MAMDFVSDSLIGGRRIRILTIADLWDRSSPALEVDMSLPGVRVVPVLEKLCLQGRLPQRINVDNGPECSGKALDAWYFIPLSIRAFRWDPGSVPLALAKVSSPNEKLCPARSDRYHPLAGLMTSNCSRIAHSYMPKMA